MQKKGGGIPKEGVGRTQSARDRNAACNSSDRRQPERQTARSAQPDGFQPKEKQEIYLDQTANTADIFPDNSL